MSVTPIIINSSTRTSIDGHFRVSAGPGAGKTHWLVEHIKNVLQHSTILSKTKKIACITYTNIAVDTIVRRLDFIADRVEVTTIHGFLYRHIVKPYASFIAAEFGLNVGKIDGHDDHYPSRQKIKDWLTSHVNINSLASPYTYNQLTRLPNNMAALKNWISSISYELDPNGLHLSADNSKAVYSNTRLAKAACLDKLSPGLLDYKKLFWIHGILHHEDVMFFAYTLINRYPFILTILRAKFPYFFIDEFQDTSPIQTEIIKRLGQSGTSIGIIGDKAQSIYKFQGAEMEHFSQFTLPGLVDYVIADNRRSTTAIVNVLNSIRSDLQQRPIRRDLGSRPTIYVGDVTVAYDEITASANGRTVATLSRDNITANAMKRNLTTSAPSTNMLEKIFEEDSNSDRRKAIVYCANALELARQNRFKEAIKEMEKNFRTISGKAARKKAAFSCLSFLLSNYDYFKSQPLATFYQLIRTNFFQSLSNLSKGAALTLYSTCTYEQLAVCINIKDDDSPNRTIHKAKGDEFDTVIVILKEEDNLTFLLNPNLLQTELHRIFYVAVSRARDRLFISTPSLDATREARLSLLFDVRRI